MIKKLAKNHKILCTSRQYSEVTNLAKIRKFKLILVGKHGGPEKFDKLTASIQRNNKLAEIIKKELPDVAISFCSPEATRVSFGIGIKHVAFSDSPHAKAVMRLSIPLVQKLLTPWIIPKKEFTQYGINPSNIIQYKAIDAASIAKRKITKNKILWNKKKKTILIRIEEEQAAYRSKNTKIISIINNIIKNFENENVIVLGRYTSQIKNLKQIFGNKIKILDMSFDGKLLLENTDVFVGSGGTMTAESSLLGVPTISYSAIPNFVEDFLVRKKLITKEKNPKKIAGIIANMLKASNKKYQKKAKTMLNQMEDPYSALVKAIRR